MTCITQAPEKVLNELLWQADVQPEVVWDGPDSGARMLQVFCELAMSRTATDEPALEILARMTVTQVCSQLTLSSDQVV